MKRKILGVILIIIPIYYLRQNLGIFKMPFGSEYIGTLRIFINVTMILSSVLYGILLQTRFEKIIPNCLRIIFFIGLIIWIGSELPIYECYYGVGHSIWKYKAIHFH